MHFPQQPSPSVHLYGGIPEVQGLHLFRALAESIPYLVWLAKTDGTILYSNTMARNLTEGQPIPDLVVLWNRLCNVEDNLRLREKWANATTSGSFAIDVRLQQPGTGHHPLYHMKGQPISIEQDQSGSWIVIATEVEEKVQLARRTAYLAAVEALSPDAIIGITSDGIITSWNAGAEHLVGYQAAEAIGRQIDIILPRDLSGNENPVLHHIRTGSRLNNYEIEQVRKGGTRIPVYLSTAPVKDDNGHVVGAVVLARPVPGRITTEKMDQDTNALIRAGIDNIPAPVFVKDHTGHYLFINAAGARVVGKRLDDILGQDDAALLGSQAAQVSDNLDREVMESGVPQTNEVQCVTSASPRTYLVTRVPYRNEQAQVSGILGISQDVTNRKREENKLRESEERLRIFVDHATDGYFLHDIQGLVLDVNEQACLNLGYQREELIDMNIQDYDRDTTLDMVENRFTRIGADQTIEYESRHQRKDGSTFPVEIRTRTLKSGENRFYLSLVRDITERREAEESLRIRDRAIQAVPQGILITDATLPDNPIIYVNAGFEKLNSYDATEILGRNCRMLRGSETSPMALAVLADAIREGKSAHVEILNYRKDGTSYWCDYTLSPLCDSTGRTTNFVGVQTDITQKKRMQERSVQSQKMELVGRLASNIAHDFSNLLVVIGGYGDLVRKDLPPSGPARAWVEEMVQAGKRAGALIRQLLTFGRKQITSPASINLNAAIESLRTTVLSLVDDNIVFKCDLGTDVWPVQLDAEEVEQIVLNITINARDAMPSGGELTITTGNLKFTDCVEQVESLGIAGDHVLLRISDTGIGMTEEVKARIPEPFFTTKDQGAGLGLAKVFAIVEQAGGRIKVESTKGVGTALSIFLPRAEGATAVLAEDTAPAGQGNEVVLLVEDDLEVRSLAAIVLLNAGYTVLAATDGNEALRVVAEETGPIHLMVADVGLPKMSGPQLASEVSKLHPETRVLLVSGYTAEALAKKGITSNTLNFLQKPYTPTLLMRKVREVLNTNQASDKYRS